MREQRGKRNLTKAVNSEGSPRVLRVKLGNYPTPIRLASEGRALLTSQQMALPKPKQKARTGSKKTARKAVPASGRPRELVIITGMSGSGKASVLKAFEDLGFYCVDNLPVELIPRFAELVGQSSEITRTALVVDVR
jgi:hypothetical protein